MARAYHYCESGPPSEELLVLNYIREFGVEAVLGKKQLDRLEMYNMILSQRVVDAYQRRSMSKDWAKWAEDNPKESHILSMAMIACEEYYGE
jgi:hypothetical protein